MKIIFSNRNEALSWVTTIAKRGNSVFGRVLYPALWVLVQLSVRGMGKVTKVKGASHMRVEGPVIYVSNHISNWDFPRIVMNTTRHMRPLYKISAFRNIIVRIFISFGGALPIVQPPKDGEKRSLEDRKSSVYLVRATHTVFSSIICAGGAGMVFAQGTRCSADESIDALNPALMPIFDHEGADPLIVVIGLTATSMVVHAGISRSKMPSDKTPFLCDLQKRIQEALDDAIEMTS